MGRGQIWILLAYVVQAFAHQIAQQPSSFVIQVVPGDQGVESLPDREAVEKGPFQPAAQRTGLAPQQAMHFRNGVAKDILKAIFAPFKAPGGSKVGHSLA